MAIYESTKRSVYLMTPRLGRHPFLALFDGADTNASTPDRAVTTVPTQALFWMNDPLVHEESQAFARRLLGESDPDARFNLAYRTALALPHSRYPVLGTSVDDVLGFVHIRDLVQADADGDGVIEAPPRTLRDVVRPIPFLPETNHVLRTLQAMRKNGQHIGLVVDEYGGTAGIVTLEDLVEELVGEIYDEFDAGVREHEDTVLRSGEAVLVDGGLIIQEVPEETGLTIPEGHYETVGGFVMDRLGRVARPGDAVQVDGCRLEVLAVDRSRVERVRITRLPDDGPS
jgi:putative hemolysin